METEPKDVIVLGSIRRGKKKFSNIQNETKITSEELNSILEETSNELDVLKSEIKGFDNTLLTASDKIDQSTFTIASSVKSISEASSQLNSLLFPIIASIGLIVALQITIIARRK